ncbi:alpha/beta fold hydrolase [Leifsonia sp. Root112D2]|uniref:alpha/beta fold hydrolase n=1 Tax=Leifsonia sp. Root112D2 TaxID=1736426 RepID=UPI0006FD2C44|nr:alpha/beta fold hydrolase [Leifsonia sp. Root112D2]KQV06500.1 lysophospholipase [Leifsonia sp. Root112D2]
MPQFTDEDGVAISYYVWPVEHPRAIVQIAHGVGEHARRYAHVAEALNTAGYTVYADDHRGHGQTGLDQWGGDASRLGRLGVGGLRAAVRDVHQFSEIIRAQHPDAPLVLIGHSWGSFMAQMVVNRHAADYAAVVLSGSAYRMVGSLNSGDLNARHKHLGTTGAEWLSRDPAVAQGFVDDALTTLTPLAKLFGPADTLRILGRPARGLPARLPLLIQVGADDPVGGIRSNERLAESYRSRSGLTDVTLQVYEGARHEIYNETNRDEVIADLVAWLDARFPPRP